MPPRTEVDDHADAGTAAIGRSTPAVSPGRRSGAGAGAGADREIAGREVVARAPARIDFGGGWTDVPPYSVEMGGAVCNRAIALHATATVSAAADGPAGAPVEGDALLAAALRRAGLAHDAAVRLALTSDYPVGAGLGGSSAAGVALAGALAAWRGEHPEPAELAERSRAVEVEELRIAGGRQDHYAAALGGALLLGFGPGETVEARRLELSPTTVAAIETRCLVAYTGEARVSGAMITGVLDAYRAGDRRVLDSLGRLRALALSMADALVAGDLDALAGLVGEHWVHQRALHPAIPTARIDALLEAARCAGGLGGKALGASGGGCVLVIAPAGGEEPVRRALARDATILPVRLDMDGFRLIR
ncbi:MAG: GHMP family kinase ATP-binding protein [Gemmatimonadaceae bacterium]